MLDSFGYGEHWVMHLNCSDDSAVTGIDTSPLTLKIEAVELFHIRSYYREDGGNSNVSAAFCNALVKLNIMNCAESIVVRML